MEQEKIDCGVLLGFDDYSPDTWKNNFSLFDKYNARVSFFVQLEAPTSFCFEAQERGHEIAYHTITHPHLQDLTKDEFFRETVSCIDNFRGKGIALTSFAYPYGDCEDWMHLQLLKYYKVLRGFRDFTLYDLNVGKKTYLCSSSIDNYFYRQGFSEHKFRADITKKLKSVRRNNAVAAFTSHEIGSNDWGITPQRLEWFLQMCVKLKLQFYTYGELVNF